MTYRKRVHCNAKLRHFLRSLRWRQLSEFQFLRASRRVEQEDLEKYKLRRLIAERIVKADLEVAFQLSDVDPEARRSMSRSVELAKQVIELACDCYPSVVNLESTAFHEGLREGS